MYVSRREAQNPESRVDEQILPPVVLHEAIAVIAAVVLDYEPRGGVIEVRPTQESTLGVTKIGLNLRVWEARLHQQPPQPCLHR